MFKIQYYPPYPIMYQSFSIEAQTDATRRCIIVILLVQLSLGGWGVIRANMGTLPLQISALP